MATPSDQPARRVGGAAGLDLAAGLKTWTGGNVNILRPRPLRYVMRSDACDEIRTDFTKQNATAKAWRLRDRARNGKVRPRGCRRSRKSKARR